MTCCRFHAVNVSRISLIWQLEIAQPYAPLCYILYSMRFYDTQQGAVVEFLPPTHGPVRIYTCGVTPYDAAHVGHIFTFMTYDILQRRLEDEGFEVQLVRNVTDVDEPIYVRAAENGEDYRQLAARETGRLRSVLDNLHFRPAYAEPLASEYIGQMAEAVKKLLDQGDAYHLERDIYFDTGRSADFETSVTIPSRLLVPLMAERGGDPGRHGKRQPLDFLLWKGVTDDDPIAWQTVIGRGRPGWHIECSVMSEALLGENFDIHGGGMDLVFPHHACERAQTAALTGSPQARHWMHVAPTALYGEKMSKSLGNLVFAHELLERWQPDTIRLALMSYHYRTGGEWQDERLTRAETIRSALQTIASSSKLPDTAAYLESIRQALDDDLNMPLVWNQLCCLSRDTRTAIDSDGSRRAALTAIGNLLGLSAIAS